MALWRRGSDETCLTSDTTPKKSLALGGEQDWPTRKQVPPSMKLGQGSQKQGQVTSYSLHVRAERVLWGSSLAEDWDILSSPKFHNRNPDPYMKIPKKKSLRSCQKQYNFAILTSCWQCCNFLWVSSQLEKSCRTQAAHTSPEIGKPRNEID